MALVRTLLFLALIGCGLPKKVSYDSYQVIRVTPGNVEHAEILRKLEDNGIVDIWSGGHAEEPWEIMVSPKSFNDLLETLKTIGLPWEVSIRDVGRTLEDTRSARNALHRDAASRTQFSAENFAHNKFLRYDEILKYVDFLVARGRALNLNVSVETIGQSTEKRDIRVLKIGATSLQNGAPRRAVFIDGGIHAREWISPSSVLYVADQLINNKTVSDSLIDDVDFYIVPVLNPDGYEYTHTTDRLWRKTRSKTFFGLGCTGVDANRNFDHHWRESGASWFSCSSTYAGTKAFSEPETRALRDFLMAHKGDIKAYLTYHSYGNFLLYPWGYSAELPQDHKWLNAVAKRANAAMVAAGSKPYKIGSSAVALYPAAGGSDDWAKAVGGIPLSYTIELPGGGDEGFNPPPSDILKTGRETLVGITEFVKEVKTM